MCNLRRFIGLLQFFCRFIKAFSIIAPQLTNLTRKGSVVHRWDVTCDEAIEKLKKDICQYPVMSALDCELPFRCHVDDSAVAVGGKLPQPDEDWRDRAGAYFSKRLNSAEEKYTANDSELLGIVYFLKRFRCYLEGAEFEVNTCNKVLKHFFEKRPQWTGGKMALFLVTVWL